MTLSVFQSWLESGMERGYFSAAAFALMHKGAAPQYLCVGQYSCEEGEQLVTSKTIFDCASVTKSVPTALIALQLIQNKTWQLEMPVCEILPELGTNYREQIRLIHLLTHTLDYRLSMSSLKDLAPLQIWDRILNYQFAIAPGESYLYCNATSMVLGLCLERFLGQPLDQIAVQKVFEPLGMLRAGFEPLKLFAPHEIVPTEICPWRGHSVCGAVHDESAFALRPQTLGSAGLFASIEDLAQVVQMIISKGGHGQCFLAAEMMDLICADHLPQLHRPLALGFEKNQERWMSARLPIALGKTGFTGSCLLGDLKLGGGMALLCNWTWPHRKSSPDAIFAFRKEGTEILADYLLA